MRLTSNDDVLFRFLLLTLLLFVELGLEFEPFDRTFPGIRPFLNIVGGDEDEGVRVAVVVVVVPPPRPDNSLNISLLMLEAVGLSADCNETCSRDGL